MFNTIIIVLEIGGYIMSISREPVGITQQTPLPSTFQFASPSTKRTLRNWCQKVIDLFRSLSYHWSNVNLGKGKTIPEVYDSKNYTNLQNAVNQLYKTRVIGGSAAMAYSEHLRENHLNLQVDETLLIGGQVGYIKDQEEGKSLIAIPIVISGLFRNHIMCAVVDTNKQCLEFYDSQGLTVLDRAGDKTLAGESLPAVIEAIARKHGVTHIIENTTKHQDDVHSCGIHVLDYMEQRASGISSCKIFREGPSGSVHSDLRKKMITALESHSGKAEDIARYTLDDVEWPEEEE